MRYGTNRTDTKLAVACGGRTTPKLMVRFLRHRTLRSILPQLHERQRALGGKLELVANTAQTLLDLLQNRRSPRVEWYIVIHRGGDSAYLYELFLHN